MNKLRIKIKGEEYELRYSIRMYMLFETMMGRTFQGGLTDCVTLLYCAFPGGVVTLDDVIDAIDEDPRVFDAFCQWLNRNAEEQRERAGRTEGEDTSEDKKKV